MLLAFKTRITDAENHDSCQDEPQVRDLQSVPLASNAVGPQEKLEAAERARACALAKRVTCRAVCSHHDPLVFEHVFISVVVTAVAAQSRIHSV